MTNINNLTPGIVLGNRKSELVLPKANYLVLDNLEELNKLMLKKIFSKSSGTITPQLKTVGVTVDSIRDFAKLNQGKYSNNTSDLFRLLQFPLTPRYEKKTNSKLNPWPAPSLLERVHSSNEQKTGESITDAIKRVANGSKLYLEFLRLVRNTWHSLPYNYKLLLQIKESRFNYDGIVSYIIAYAYYVRDINTVETLMEFFQDHDNGFKSIHRYLVISSARQQIDKIKLCISSKVGANDDNMVIYTQLVLNNVSLQDQQFSSTLSSEIEEYKEFGFYRGLIEDWNTNFTSTIIEERDINSAVEVLRFWDRDGISFSTYDDMEPYIPNLRIQINERRNQLTLSSTSSITGSDDDFTVDYYSDTETVLDISKSNVRCAAQLYYAMTLGDELEVFNVVKYLTQKFMVKGGMEIRDRQLRDHLQMYVFNNKFIDSKTGKEYERTKPQERLMFYKQVFNYGNAKAPDDIILNREFARLWKVMMVESAKFIERAQESPYPMNFVSKQNVKQSVEDLQYNLSVHCSGMVNVITPIIYKELDFVIQNILNHDEVRRMVVPSGGTWYRVVENLFASMNSRRKKTTAIYNKAKTGHEIISLISEYNPSTFQNDDSFSAFISGVDSFITTQSILQDSVSKLKDSDRIQDDIENDEDLQESPVAELEKDLVSDEWDF